MGAEEYINLCGLRWEHDVDVAAETRKPSVASQQAQAPELTFASLF